MISPWLMKDIDRAVKRVLQAAKQKERVLIFGDYDVDGVTAVALLKSGLKRLGIPLMHYIPHRIKVSLCILISTSLVYFRANYCFSVTLSNFY